MVLVQNRVYNDICECCKEEKNWLVRQTPNPRHNLEDRMKTRRSDDGYKHGDYIKHTHIYYCQPFVRGFRYIKWRNKLIAETRSQTCLGNGKFDSKSFRYIK